jgi:predicted nucleic acid-binding protein
MIVVSDTSPINYLILIEFQHLLPTLFERVLIPEAVQRELRAGGTLEPVRQFVDAAPAWLEVRSVPNVPATLTHLDAGEGEAIALGLAVGAEVILLDERKGRQAAKEQGRTVSGMLGVIGLAAERKLVSLEDAIDRLQKTNFRVSPRLLKRVREGTVGR